MTTCLNKELSIKFHLYEKEKKPFLSKIREI